jgi:Lysylphosphatidylglycerol synthase TM region
VSAQRRVIAGVAFASLTLATSFLVARRLTHASWPLQDVEPGLATVAAVTYIGSFVFRARAWRRLFPGGRPGQAHFLASVGAAAASGAVLPFRLDYLVKVGVLRKLGGIRVGLGTIAVSIVSLGIVDAIALLPLSISATAMSKSALRGPLLIVVIFGVVCCTLLSVGRRISRLPLLHRRRRLHMIREYVARYRTSSGRNDAVVAWVYLLAGWSMRACGCAALLAAFGLSFSPNAALTVICISAAAGVTPITLGGAAANAGTTAATLLALGVGRDIAINYSLASGLLMVMSAVTASAFGVALAMSGRLRRNFAASRFVLAPVKSRA